MHMHGSQEEDFWAAKGKQIKSKMRNKSLCRSGRGREFVGEAEPRGAQQYARVLILSCSGRV
jgi:hypothetical protein